MECSKANSSPCRLLSVRYEETDMMRKSEFRKSLQAGFSLIELTISILILVLIMGAVFKQVDNIQKNTKTESMKLDLTQQNRDFVDRFARDIHMSGYPISKVYQNSGGPTDKTLALGLDA